MKTLSRILFAALGAAALSSCYYPAYDGGYSSSIGYSGGGATFIHTSNDRWFYDSSVRCYYDRDRYAYYDPWLNGYYPRGYCPQPVTYVPHPYGWSGHGVCPVPRSVNYRQINRYQDRVSLLRAKNHSWASNVRVQQRTNSQGWSSQRARQAEQYAKNPGRSGRQGTATQQRSQATQPSYSRGATTRTPQVTQRSPSRSPSRSQATPAPRSGSASRSQSTAPSRSTSRPATRPSNPPATSRPGYRQPVAAPPARAPKPQPQKKPAERSTPLPGRARTIPSSASPNRGPRR